MKKHILALAICSTLFSNLTWGKPETESQENNCQQPESIDKVDLEAILKDVDERLKGLVITMADDSKMVDQESVKLVETFRQLHEFMKQNQDLHINKAAILEKQDIADKQNDSVKTHLEQVASLFDNTKNELKQAYCSVGGLYAYFEHVAATTEDPQTRTSATTSRDQLKSKVKKLEKIMDDFEKFFNDLNVYTQGIETSTFFLMQFANSVVAFENVTCKEKQGEPCLFPSKDIQGLLAKQDGLIKINKTFTHAKTELLKRSKDWGNLSEQA